MEACTLRLEDVDLERLELVIRQRTRGRDRLMMLPDALREDVAAQISLVRSLHRREVAAASCRGTPDHRGSVRAGRGRSAGSGATRMLRTYGKANYGGGSLGGSAR
jgi:integrase